MPCDPRQTRSNGSPQHRPHREGNKMGNLVGRRIKRTEDPRLITGRATYVDDVKLPGMLHVHIVRSPYSHARLAGIRADAVRDRPGVWGVFTGEDLQAGCGTVPTASAHDDLKVPKRWPLAVEKVRYVGEGVVAVVADDLYSARDAADLIEIEYEPLDAVVDPEMAMRRESPVIHTEWDNNIAFTWSIEGGDVDQAFQTADRIVTRRFINQRVVPVPMEGRGAVARYDSGSEELTLWSSTQIPHLLRTQLAHMLGMPENRLRVIAPEVGGAFGCKLNVYAEEALCGYVSKSVGRPVKWTEHRRENMVNTIHGRDQINDVELAVKSDGTLLGIKCQIVADIGAYQQLLTAAIPTLTGLMICGPYKIAAAEVRITGVFTNKMATDAYRGAGRPEATYVVERMMDCVAAELGMDKAELRRKNFPLPAEFPFKTATDLE
ncbi:MAG: xanthine dehydrogenase family protein molybdopterin-binding subunit, partial [Acidobacteriota bacterium]